MTPSSAQGSPAAGVAPVPLLLNRSEVGALLSLADCIPAVESAFAAHATGAAFPPALMHVDADGGEFHYKAGGLRLGERVYTAIKANGGFFQNRARLGLPNIQGLIILADGSNGCPLAVMDSRDITWLRTAAATAVAAKYLARPDARVATIAGCGAQGRVQLQALTMARRLTTVHVWSRDVAKVDAFARQMSAELSLEVVPAPSLAAAVGVSDIVVTCTPARRFFVTQDMVAPGTFIAAVGADSPDKQEIDPALLARAAVVCDLTDQCEHVGDLHHAISAGLMKRDQVRGELGAIIAGQVVGRRSPDEIVVFDSTGTALQDVAAAAAVYERALASGRGLRFPFTA
ncbi:MAG TPA: ornithine cyclodeaminase family protein [Opitutaceae bacterium]